MCVIVVRPIGIATPTMKVFEQCWNRNGHGGGLMYVDAKGQFKVIRGLMTWPEMKKQIAKIPEGTMAAYHFRIGTNGSNTAENTHPWPIPAENAALMHNGIINFLADDREISDSKRLADTIDGLGGYFLNNKLNQNLVQAAIGFNNKVVVMDCLGYVILNAHMGVWDGGCWYSNTSYVVYEQQTFLPKMNNFDYDWPSVEMPKVSLTSVKLNPLTKFVNCISSNGGKFAVRLSEFIEDYAMYTYIPSLKQSIDFTVAQWAIQHDRKKRGTKNR